MTQHVMLDLETWGKGPDAAIVSIGAVKFDPEVSIDGHPRNASSHIIEVFHIGIDPESCELHGLKINASTMKWWMHLDQAAARDAWFKMELLDLASGLHGFCTWFKGDRTPQEPKPIWGHGVSFDNMILRNALDAVGLECPWSHKDDRDFRTLKNLAEGLEPEKEGTTHDALDDAIFQTKWLINIKRHLGLTL